MRRPLMIGALVAAVTTLIASSAVAVVTLDNSSTLGDPSSVSRMMGGTDIAPAHALTRVWGYGVGLDLTRRDLQAVAKEMRRPWDFAKGFDASAPCSPIHPVREVGHPHDARIWLSVNGAVLQDGTLKEMIWPVADIIAHISRFVALAPGDLIFTGTPAGVGPLQPGDSVKGALDGVASFNFRFAPAST